MLQMIHRINFKAEHIILELSCLMWKSGQGDLGETKTTDGTIIDYVCNSLGDLPP